MQQFHLERPRSVVAAALLLGASFTTGMYLMAGRMLQKMPGIPHPLLYGLDFVALALLGVVVYFMFRGNQWARFTCLALVAVRTLSGLNQYVSSPSAPIAAVIVIELAAAILLLLPRANDWFKRSSAEP